MSERMPLTRQIRHEKGLSRKETRWDRIRKRNCGNTNLSLKTEAVKRFIEMDFIGSSNETLLRGEKKMLNPAVVMDMRHAMFQKARHHLPLATVANEKTVNACVAHNIAVEEHYITNQLNRFRQQLESDHKRRIKVNQKPQYSLKLDNVQLVKSLEATSKHIEDFYAAPIEALQKVQEMYTFTELNDNETIEDEGPEKDRECQGDDFASNEHEREMVEPEKLQFTANTCDRPNLQATVVQGGDNKEREERMRCVRFEDAVEMRKYCVHDHSPRSTTSDGIDSVISHLAEEALRELEEEEKQQQLQLAQEVPTIVQNEKEAGLTSSNEASTQRSQPAPITRIQINGQTDVDEGAAEDLLVVRRLELQQQSTNARAKQAAADELTTTSEDGDDALSTASNHEQNRIIETLFQARAHTNIATMRKYLLQWIHYTTIAKIERENCTSRNDRVHKINVFLDKMRREKRRPLREQELTGAEKGTSQQKDKLGAVQISKKYQTKIKVQQDIIDLQRVKLERQERLIMQLKLNKFSEEALNARQQIKDELKTVIRCGDAKSRAKAKCLQLIGNLRDADDDDDFERLQGRGLLLPKFLQNMQERALERSVRHEQARQRRLQQEAEREAQKTAAEEAKQLEDEEAKRMRIAALKEKRRLEKMAKVLRERERQRSIENAQKAKAFCRRLLLRRVGMEAFKRLLERKRNYQQQCAMLRRRISQRACFQMWRNYAQAQLLQKTMRADNNYDKLLKRRGLQSWKDFMEGERSKYYTAGDWYNMKLSDAFFTHWCRMWRRDKAIEEKKLLQAKAHYEWNLKWSVMERWRRLQRILELEKQTEERRQRWRLKIWDLIPDYEPERNDFCLD